MNEKINQIVEKIKNADAVLIGASNGLSISEGYNIFAENNDFIELFSDFRDKYGIHSILQGVFYDYPSDQEKWVFFSRLINKFCNQYETSEAMKDLYELVNEKPYFIVTSNIDGHFELSGFKQENIFNIEGSLLNMQCTNGCHEGVYPTEEAAQKIIKYAETADIPDEVMPKCPKCGKVMNLNVTMDEAFIQDKQSARRCSDFIQKYRGKNLVILELGIGWRNKMIKAPFMDLAAEEKNAVYITLNKGEVYIPDHIKDKSYGVDGDMTTILKEINNTYKIQ